MPLSVSEASETNMDKEQILDLIDKTLKAMEEVALNSKYLRIDAEPLLSTKKVLIALKKELENNANSINERILRAMHDIGMSSYKDFENTSLEDALINLVSLLNREIPNYKNLQPYGNTLHLQ